MVAIAEIVAGGADGWARLTQGQLHSSGQGVGYLRWRSLLPARSEGEVVETETVVSLANLEDAYVRLAVFTTCAPERKSTVIPR